MRNLSARFLVSALSLVLLVNGFHATALSGSQTCPTSVATADMSAWCTARFGGYGGTLTAGAWDHHRQSFDCICNANTDAAITITRLSTTTTTTTTTTSTTLSPSVSSSAHKSHSSSWTDSSEDSDSARYDSLNSLSGPSSSSSSSLSHAAAASSFRQGSSASSSSSSSDMTVTGTCSWNGVFTEYPDGVQCMPSTGLCPMSCSVVTSLNLCNNQYTNGQTCTDVSAYMMTFTCLTCNGRNYTIQSRSVSDCTRYYTGADTCDAKSSCNGHGCCVGTTSSSGSTSTTCSCYNDGLNGYYTGSSCSTCQSGYTTNSAGLCLAATNKVQFILAKIARTWTMVAPNMAVLFLFVIFGVTRKLNASDRPFDLTGLRRANLSTVQVARRRQQSLFHSKYIPMRPAKSRSFANPHQPQTRGPPAF